MVGFGVWGFFEGWMGAWCACRGVQALLGPMQRLIILGTILIRSMVKPGSREALETPAG
jgi:hypothetical protein